MRLLVQRVIKSSVTIDGKPVSNIGEGILIFLGIKNGDTAADADFLAKKCAALRIFEDASGKMNLSIEDIKGEAMVVSQFTLYGDARKGNRPDYTAAAPPEIAEPLYDYFIEALKKLLNGLHVASGVFRAMMKIELVNDGPVTLIIDSKNQVANG